MNGMDGHLRDLLEAAVGEPPRRVTAEAVRRRVIRRRDDPEIYVRRAMLNTWSSWRRRRWWGERATETVPDRPAVGDLAAEAALRIAVQGVLGSLTARQRAVLVLRVFDDLSEAQVAQVLGCAVGTVKATLAHAVVRLREDPRLAGLMDRETQ